MAYQFETKLEFSGEALGFLASEDRFAEVGGKTYLKAGPAGLPADLAGSVGVVLVLRDRSAVGRDGAGGSWKAACSYDVGALSPIEGYEYSAYGGLFGPGRGYEVAELVYARSKEVEHAMPASALSRAARDGSGLLLWGGFFTPRLDRSPDMASFLGVKYRGKWVYRVA